MGPHPLAATVARHDGAPWPAPCSAPAFPANGTGPALPAKGTRACPARTAHQSETRPRLRPVPRPATHAWHPYLSPGLPRMHSTGHTTVCHPTLAACPSAEVGSFRTESEHTERGPWSSPSVLMSLTPQIQSGGFKGPGLEVVDTQQWWFLLSQLVPVRCPARFAQLH